MTAPVKDLLKDQHRETRDAVESASTELQRLAEIPSPALQRRPETPVGSTVGDLVRVALEMRTPVAELREIVALGAQIEARDARKAFFAAMAAFKKECPPIPRSSSKEKDVTGSGQQASYTWAKQDEIDRTISPCLTANGLSYSFDTDSDATHMTCVCTVRHDAGHEQSARVRVPLESKAGMSPVQKVGSAMQHATRYALILALGLSTTDETPDSDEANPEKVSEDQATHLADMLRDSAVVPSRFLKYMGLEEGQTVADIRAVDYDAAVTALSKKKGAPNA